MIRINVSLITILWNGGEVVAGAGRVGSRSRRELLGLCAGLLGRCPVSAGLLTEGVDRGVEGGKEVIWIEGANEFVALELRSDRVLEFGEHEGGAVGVEFLVEVGEHIGCGGVDVGARRLRGGASGRGRCGRWRRTGVRRTGRSRGPVVPQRWGTVAGRDGQATLGRGRVWSGKATMLVG